MEILAHMKEHNKARHKIIAITKNHRRVGTLDFALIHITSYVMIFPTLPITHISRSSQTISESKRHIEQALCLMRPYSGPLYAEAKLLREVLTRTRNIENQPQNFIVEPKLIPMK